MSRTHLDPDAPGGANDRMVDAHNTRFRYGPGEPRGATVKADRASYDEHQGSRNAPLYVVRFFLAPLAMKAIASLMIAGKSFHAEPWPDEEWRLTVKNEPGAVEILTKWGGRSEPLEERQSNIRIGTAPGLLPHPPGCMCPQCGEQPA